MCFLCHGKPYRFYCGNGLVTGDCPVCHGTGKAEVPERLVKDVVSEWA